VRYGGVARGWEGQQGCKGGGGGGGSGGGARLAAEGREGRCACTRGMCARSHLQNARDEHGHPGHSTQRSERPDSTHGADGGGVAQIGKEDGQPRERDNDRVDLAPWVAQVRVLVAQHAARHHLPSATAANGAASQL
jgi:hypothetical protein